ncbi:AMP-dependent synthetase/ligase, partial [Streptomyces scabiei]|uniref:AMP-dependent synthetase/ligase n=1 Tax=Streptomyces scabiei TaxID=1930 RepID=UPI0039F02A9B
FEKVYNGVAAKARAGGGAKYKIFQWAAGIAREYAKVTQDNFKRTGTASAPAGLRTKHAVADRLVYAKIREAFGGRLRACVSGSAALAPEIGYFFAGAGIHILEGYGLTESSAASFVNPGEAYRTGTVGKPLPGTEVRIADDGEILLRGPGIMEGYHKLPEKTAEVLEADGWFHTGDIGTLDEDGYLRITGRKKEIIVTAGGKNVAPAVMEDRIRAHALVAECMVVGDGRPFVGALVTLDEEFLGRWCAEHGKPAGSTAVTLREDPELLAAIQDAIDDGNAAVSKAESVRKFRVLGAQFTEDSGHLTPSLKLKRNVVAKDYADEIEAIYAK